jgi:parvulin-like peptidyl-prolyl isomerase
MKTTRLVTYSMLLAAVAVGCGGGSGIIASGGSFELSVEDLRFEVLKLGPSSRYEDTSEGRKAVVENLAARHYLGEEALNRGYGTEEIGAVGGEAEAAAVAEAYHRWKVDNRILLPRVKTKTWIPKLDRRLYLKDMVFAVQPVAEQVLDMMRAGRDFDSLAESAGDREDIRVNDLGWVIWKDLGRDIANVVFRLDKGEVTDVIIGADGYHIFYLADDEPFGISIELLSMRSKRFVTAMETEQLENAERRELAAKYHLRFREAGVRAALEAFSISFEGGRPPDSLMNLVLATYSDEEVLVAHPYNIYYSMSAQARPYIGDAYAIQHFTTNLALPRLETLAGYAMGMDRLREVGWAVKQAREEFLVGLMEDAFKGQIEIGPDDIATYYEERGPEMVTSGRFRVRRILVETMQDARQVQREMGRGRDFAEVAKEWSQDEYTASNGGDLGFIHFGFVVPYDSIAAALSVGEVSNPFKTEAGIEILKMEEKEEPRQLTFEEAEPYIITFITNTRANEMLAEWVGEKKAEVGFSIDEDLLGRVSLPLPGYREQTAKPSEAVDTESEAESD